MPFASHCSEWAKQEATAAKLIAGITQQCEVTVYGRWSGGGGAGGRGAAARPVHGRCSDSEYADWTRQLSPACCGADLQRCGGSDWSMTPAVGVVVVTAGSCVAGCPVLYEAFYAECHPRLEAEGLGTQAEAFLALCQGVSGGGPGGGH